MRFDITQGEKCGKRLGPAYNSAIDDVVVSGTGATKEIV